MADDKKAKSSLVGNTLNFYFTPELHSIATLFYFGIFGYFTLYYIDNIFIAIKFLFYIVLGHTALQGPMFLFTGMVFVISLVLPFALSFYSIFVLPNIWKKPQWSIIAKWSMTIIVIIGGLAIIIISDNSARVAARQPSMQSFVEDTDLTGRI